MNPLKDCCRSVVNYLNQPPVKEGVKNVISGATFTFGLVELYSLVNVPKAPSSSRQKLKWIQTANKVITVSGICSRLLSAAVSRPGVFLISKAMTALFTTPQLERVFGVNTIFERNPWHIRHVASIAAVILALPALGRAVCRGRKGFKEVPSQILLFNTLTSRPVLHLGNLKLSH